MEDRRRAVCRPKASGVWSVAWGVQLIHLDSYWFPTIPLFQAFQALFLDFFLIPCSRVDSICNSSHFCFIFDSSQDGLAVFQCLPYERWHHAPCLRLLHRSCDEPKYPIRNIRKIAENTQVRRHSGWWPSQPMLWVVPSAVKVFKHGEFAEFDDGMELFQTPSLHTFFIFLLFF